MNKQIRNNVYISCSGYAAPYTDIREITELTPPPKGGKAIKGQG